MQLHLKNLLTKRFFSVMKQSHVPESIANDLDLEYATDGESDSGRENVI